MAKIKFSKKTALKVGFIAASATAGYASTVVGSDILKRVGGMDITAKTFRGAVSGCSAPRVVAAYALAIPVATMVSASLQNTADRIKAKIDSMD